MLYSYIKFFFSRDAICAHGNIPINTIVRKCKAICVSRYRRWGTLSYCHLCDPPRSRRDLLADSSHPAVHDTTCPRSMELRFGAKRNGTSRLPGRSASLQPRRRRDLVLQTWKRRMALSLVLFILYKYVLLWFHSRNVWLEFVYLHSSFAWQVFLYPTIKVWRWSIAPN